MFFGSGAADPLDSLPEWIKSMVEWNPLKIWFDTLVSVYTGTDAPSGSAWKIPLTLVVSAAVSVVGLRNWRRAE